MRTSVALGILLVTLGAVAPIRLESQGIGGLIKKKAADAAKGKDGKADQGKTVAKDEGPIKSQFEKECGPLTADAIDRFLKGLQAENAGRNAYDHKLAGARPDSVVQACQSKEMMGADATAIVQRGLANGGTTAYVQKTMDQNRLDLDAYLAKKCGEPASKYQDDRGKEYDAARKAGAKAAGMSDDCYDKLEEFALFFCKGLTPAQQTIATEQGIKVPGKGSGVWVYTADEAKALAPKCAQLLQQIDATGYKLL